MNVKRFFQTALLFTLMGTTFVACESEPENVEDYLYGRWEIANATRAGQNAETLSGLYYEFDANGTMRTNLPLGGQEESSFSLDGSTISQQTEQMTVDYKIENISDTLLILSTEIRDTPFRFNMRKAQADN
jgi:hypothetical protein